MTDTTKIEEQVLACLTDHPDLTSDEVAEALGLDQVSVSVAVCQLLGRSRLDRSGMRELPGVGNRPTYKVKKNASQT